MEITGKTDLTAIVSSKVSNFTPDSDLLHKPISEKQSTRKTRNSVGGVRLKRDGPPAAGKRGSRPGTPLLRWKFVEGNKKDEEDTDVDVESENHSDSGRINGRKLRKGRDAVAVSARKLAVGLWRLQLPEVGVNGSGELCNVPKNNGFEIQHTIDHSGIHSPALLHMKEVPLSPNSVTGFRNKFRQKLEPTFKFTNSSMEGATKWDPGSRKASENVRRIYGESKHLVSELESELETARARINDLENERRSSKKKLEQFLNKLNEDRAAWRSREHEKIRAVIDDVKGELSRERKNRQRTEVVNSKLVNELTAVKLSAKRYMQDYEKERKAREILEEVCDELANEIGEDKAEVEDLKRESMKLREDVDDERKMLQMAEVWREERVQMKLVDAKVTLEDKYCQMNKVITDLETFLNSKSTNLDIEEMKRAETLIQYANSVNIQEISEFKYEPANPDDIYSIFEEVNFDQNGEDDESGWETMSDHEDRGTNYSSNESDPSVTNDYRRELEEDDGTLITEITEEPIKHPKKGSSISRLWRSYSSNGDNCKIISLDGLNGRLSNGTHPDQSSGLSGSEWSCSPGTGSNPHITNGVTQKNRLKGELLEARIESQKIRLHQVLKQKI
ncbi:uncharacterized protein [Rutidosis leptorrhynchoides]|uniref:uncharacterized protein n=1 Tax=Rutidosis leptorrhynchoides TaxID=125765 RepID=UPI003A9A3B09